MIINRAVPFIKDKQALISFDEMYDKQLEEKSKCTEFVSELNDLFFKVESGQCYAVAPQQHKEYKLQDSAVTHLLNKLGYPIAVAKHLEDDLVQKSLNSLLSSPKVVDRECLFRVYDSSELRAILSQQYCIYDNVDLLRDLKENMPVNDYLVDKLETTNHSFFVRMYHKDSNLSTKPEIGDIRKALELQNSETGFFSVKLHTLLYRLVCTNGLKGWGDTSNVSAQHIKNAAKPLAIQLQDFFLGIEDSWFDLNKFMLKSTEVVVSQPEILMKKVGDTYKCWDTESVKNPRLLKEVTEAYCGPSADASLFDVSNAFTKAAQNYMMEHDSFRKLENAGSWMIRDYKRFMGSELVNV